MISSGACKTGIVESSMVIFCAKFDVFPVKSVAVHVTIVSPMGKNSGASLVTMTLPKVSTALGSCNSIMLFKETTASATISATGVMIGEIVSTTCISCVADSEFPLLSIAVHVTIVVPNPNMGGALLTIN